MKKSVLIFLLALLLVVSTFPLSEVRAAIALPEGRVLDEAHNQGYIDWNGSVYYRTLYHRDSLCPSGCYEEITEILNGSSVSGSFQRDLLYFEVAVATARSAGFGTVVLAACGASTSVNVDFGNGTTPGIMSIPLTVPAGCRTWSLTASGGAVDLRSVDANYAPEPTATSTPLPTSTRTFTPTSTLTFTPTSTRTFTPTPTYTGTPLPTATRTATRTETSTALPTTTRTATATASSTSTALPSATWTATMTGTLIPTSTATRTATASAVPTSAPVVQQSVVIVVPNIIINSNNTNTNTNSGGGGSSGAGGFSAVTPAPMQGQGGATVWDGNVCSGYYIRARVYVDDNGDKMMSPAEGITGLNIHLLDQTYAKLGSTYTEDGQAAFCIPSAQYGKPVYLDIPYLQQFKSIQIPETPDQDIEIWFPSEPPVLPLYLP